MPDVQVGLIVGSQGDRPVAEVEATLRAIRRAHDGLHVLGELLESLDPAVEVRRRAEEARDGTHKVMPPRVALARRLGEPEFWGAFDVDAPSYRRFIAPQNELVLKSVRLSSPGFLEFLGSLNPLTFIRDMLNDRHRRRQDREYRESAERRSLELDNMLKENQVISERLGIARELGLSDHQQVTLLNQLGIGPLLELDDQVMRGGIGPIPIEPPEGAASADWPEVVAITLTEDGPEAQ